MCSRFSTSAPARAFQDLFDLNVRPEDFPPRFDVAPGEDAPLVRLWGAEPEAQHLRWGLLPNWSKGPKTHKGVFTIHAHVAQRSPSFQDAFSRRRCLIPANSIRGWQRAEGRPSHPYRVSMRDGAPFAMAGIWDRWTRAQRQVETFAILLTDSPRSLRRVDPHMPAIVRSWDYKGWLGGRAGAEVLCPFQEEDLLVEASNVRSLRPDAMQPRFARHS